MKYLLPICLTAIFFSANAQLDTIAFNGFDIEDPWGPLLFSTPPCSEQGDTWNYVSELPPILPYEGNSFWGIEDLNGNCGGSGFEWIEFPVVDIGNFRMVELSFAFNVIGFDRGDDLRYQLQLDGTWTEESIVVDGENNYTTGGWETVSIQIPNNTSTFALRFLVKQNGSDIAAIDAVTLKGKRIEACHELMISEYVEGSSSRQHRNNYIELYNPNSFDLNLKDYQLIKYTGDNPIPSSTLNLTGTIKAYSTFTIGDITENLGVDSNLKTNSQVIDFTGDDAIALLKKGQLLDLMGYIGQDIIYGQNVTLRRKSLIESPNNEYNEDEWETYSLETIDDLSKHVSSCSGPIPEIEVHGNFIPILDGSSTLRLSDNTYLGEIKEDQNTPLTASFFVHNYGNKELSVYDANFTGEHASLFNLHTESASIAPGDSLEVQVEFNSHRSGSFETTLQIHSNDASESIYDFKVAAEKTSHVRTPLLISHYYEGNANNRWIEVTNTSSKDVSEGDYFLCLYQNKDVDLYYSQPPSASKSIPSVKAGHTLLFRASLNVSQPEYALTGEELPSSVCNFNGDDILIISTSNDDHSWKKRTDRIGRPGKWGSDLSLVRKEQCDLGLGNRAFDEGEWTKISIEEVNQAAIDSPNRLGNNHTSTVQFENGVWIPHPPGSSDAVIIVSDYDTEIHGSIDACSLTLTKDATLNIRDTHHLSIEYDLIVYGELIVAPNGSLVIRSDHSLMINEGQIMIQKKSGELKPFDYTYWSSPVESETIERVFHDSPAAGKYYFNSSHFEDLDGDGLDDNGDSWQEAEGLLEIGRGYAVMAPKNLDHEKKQFVSFSGTPNNAFYEIELPFNPFGKFWHLLGNPYPSALDVEQFLTHPLNDQILNKTLYFWTHITDPEFDPNSLQYAYSSNDYAMYTLGTGGIKAVSGGAIPSHFIASCQGFFIESIKEGQAVFSNRMRTSYGNDTFFKYPEQDDKRSQPGIWLNLISNYGHFSQILIGFREGASNGFDRDFDGERLSSGQKLNFYSKTENRKVAIQGLPLKALKDSILLGYDLTSDSVTHMKIEIDSIAGVLNKLPIVLNDLVTNTSHDLSTGPYHFDSGGIQNTSDRFLLTFKTIDDLEGKLDHPNELLSIIPTDNGTLVRSIGRKLILGISLYDLMGRKLFENNEEGLEFLVPTKDYASRSVYLLQVFFEDNRSTVKFIP